jgi:hypothetical protein
MRAMNYAKAAGGPANANGKELDSFVHTPKGEHSYSFTLLLLLTVIQNRAAAP